ncbi:MAG TPA: M56 family metallopeptidase [Terriglobales bacterium]
MGILAAKSLVLLAVGFTGSALLRRSSAAARHRWWSLMLLALLVLPLAQAALPTLPLRFLPVRKATAGTAAVARVASKPAAALPASRAQAAPTPTSGQPAGGIHWGAFIGGLWLLGSLALAGRFVAALAQLRGLVRNAGEADANAQMRFQRLCARMGVGRAVTLKVSAAIDVPQASGIVQPVILVPAATTHWPAERWTLVMAHELAHAQRRDPMWLWMAHWAQAVFWWNPLVWRAARRQSLASEQACDDVALALATSDGIEAEAYAGHLVAVARALLTGRRRSSLAAAMAQPHRGAVLQIRVRAILDGGRRRGAGRWSMALLALGCCAVLTPLAAAGDFQEAAPQSALVFEAASVKPLGSTNGVHISEHSDPQRLRFSGSLHDFIMQAYDIGSPDQLTGEPRWFKSELFAIEATSAHATSEAEKMVMLRTLLADRFQLRLNTEQREMPSYDLTVAPGGPKFHALTGNTPPDPEQQPGMIVRQLTDIPQLVNMLNNRYGGPLQLDRPVVDRTGLTGRYDMLFRTELVVAGDGTPLRNATTPNLFHDLESELGLRLVRGRDSFASFVVVSASRPGPD